MKKLFIVLAVSVLSVLVIAQSKFPNKVVAPTFAHTNGPATIGQILTATSTGGDMAWSNAPASGITSINENTTAEQFISLDTNVITSARGPSLSNSVNGVELNFPWAAYNTSGALHSNDFKRIYGTNFPHGVFTNGIEIGLDGAVGQILLYDQGGTATTIEAPSDIENAGEVLRWFSTTNTGVLIKANVEGVTNRMTNVTLTAGQVVTHNGTTYAAEGKTSFTPVLVAGTGSALTNFTFASTQPEVIINGFTNVSITGVMGYDAARVDYWNLTITNGGGTARPLIFSQQTNSWRFSGVYGTNAPSSLTNMTALHISARSHGTNTRVGYTYFPWP